MRKKSSLTIVELAIVIIPEFEIEFFSIPFSYISS